MLAVAVAVCLALLSSPPAVVHAVVRTVVVDDQNGGLGVNVELRNNRDVPYTNGPGLACGVPGAVTWAWDDGTQQIGDEIMATPFDLGAAGLPTGLLVQPCQSDWLVVSLLVNNTCSNSVTFDRLQLRLNGVNRNWGQRPVPPGPSVVTADNSEYGFSCGEWQNWAAAAPTNNELRLRPDSTINGQSGCSLEVYCARIFVKYEDGLATTGTTATTGTPVTTGTTATTGGAGSPTTTSSSSSSSSTTTSSSAGSSTSGSATATSSSSTTFSSSSSTTSSLSSSSSSAQAPAGGEDSSPAATDEAWILPVIIVLAAALGCCFVALLAFLVRRRQRKGEISMGSSSEAEELVMRKSTSESPSPVGTNYGPLSSVGSVSVEESTYGAMPVTASEVGSSYSAIPTAILEAGKNTARANAQDKWLVEPKDLRWGPELGRGAFGVVFDGMWRKTRVAVKVMTEMTQEAMDDFQKEGDIMMQLRPHTNVVALLGICHEPFSLVTEFMGNGSLDVWRSGPEGASASDDVLLEIATDIAKGIFHLHAEGIFHRDLAARNVLLSDNLVAKVSDFGQARPDTDDNSTKTDTGPLKWMAPENILEHVYSAKSDSWAYGITLVELYTADIPYPDEKGLKVATRVASGAQKAYPSPPENAPEAVCELIRVCTAFSPEDRPDFEDILEQLE